MKNEKYMELLDQIKVLQPTIVDSERLTANIMQSIEKMPQKRIRKQTLTVVSWTSSIAASLLIGLFLFEQVMIPTSNELKTLALPVYSRTVLCKNINIEKQTTLTNFNDWIDLKKERQKRQQAFYIGIINKHKIL
jgi:hypothetical protein